MLSSIVFALAASVAAPQLSNPYTHTVAMTAGSEITDDQINMVRDFEAGVAAQDNPTADPDLALAIEQAAALVRICDRALGGNPRDRSRIAATYDILVGDGSIPGV
jgi:hypothetical protein